MKKGSKEKGVGPRVEQALHSGAAAVACRFEKLCFANLLEPFVVGDGARHAQYSVGAARRDFEVVEQLHKIRLFKLG